MATDRAQQPDAPGDHVQILYVERKEQVTGGPASISLVRLSKSGRSIYYRGRRLERIRGYKANYADVESGERYWVSKPRRDGRDRLYSGVVQIDDDARAAYWLEIRELPGRAHDVSYRTSGKYAR
jgi:hypothetical protein